MQQSGLKNLLYRASLAAFTAALVAAIFIIGCGGGSSSTTPAVPAGTTATQLRVGDAPADKVLSFELTIASPIVATPSGGGAPVNIAVAPNRLELSHMAGKLEPLGIVNVPQGTYSSAQVTITNPEMTYLNASNAVTKLQGSPTQTITLNFSPALTVGATPGLLNVDINVANSLALDNAGNITGFNFTGASFTIGTKAIAAQTGRQEDDSGEIEDVAGLVIAVSGANFTLKAGQSGAELAFVTDSTTQFSDGITGVAGMLNQIVKVEGITRSDGSLFAKEVEGIESETGAEVEGLVTAVAGVPATSFTLMAQDGIGSGVDGSKVGDTFTVDVSGLADSKYTVDLGNCDTTNLTIGGAAFPFDSSHIKAGQRVEVETTSAVPAANGTITADKVKLQQRALTGTVSNFVAGTGNAATFDLTVPADSHFAILSGETVVHVFQQPGTHNTFGAISNGVTLRVRGIPFWTGASFNMIARRITTP
ncbi:MAG TPA: DUF5666 domain-containing protein [Candidatus Limnocylindrales bacterium]|nr:DUF5666 domain-containing protein [Candidatus Limnocylindrales bacterium]